MLVENQHNHQYISFPVITFSLFSSGTSRGRRVKCFHSFQASRRAMTITTTTRIDRPSSITIRTGAGMTSWNDKVRGKVLDKVEVSFARKAKSPNWGYREDRNPKHNKSENHPVFASYGIIIIRFTDLTVCGGGRSGCRCHESPPSS